MLGTPLLLLKKKRGELYCCFGQRSTDERCSEKYKEIILFPFPKPKRRFQECKAWIRACGRPPCSDHTTTHMICLCKAEGAELTLRACDHKTAYRLRNLRHAGNNVTRGVTVSTSAFLDFHQCYCADSSLAWGLNLRVLVCGIF